MKKGSTYSPLIALCFFCLVAFGNEPTRTTFTEAKSGSQRLVPSYADAQTLQDATQLLKQELVRTGKDEFLPLLSADRIRKGFSQSLLSYTENRGRFAADQRGYLEEAVFPRLEVLRSSNRWPKGAKFSVIYKITDSTGQTCEGLGVRLEIETPNGASTGFALPILDCWYGRTSLQNGFGQQDAGASRP